ncbi:MAG: pyridoxamine 5'-phosphate oxidase family protein [Kiritimatiellia bacterium]
MEILKKVWEERKGPAVLGTVDGEGRPNAIYVGEIRYRPETGFVVADNFFSKTRANIKSGSKGTVLFITNKGKSYQAKGELEYHTEGEIFEDMKAWHNSRLPGVAATVLKVEEVYSGAEKLT